MQNNKAIIFKNYQPITIAGTLCQVVFSSFGKVQLAKCMKTGKLVAIKVIRDHLSREYLQFLKKIKHQNILRLLDFHINHNQNKIFMIYEYFQGRTLLQYVKYRVFKDKQSTSKIFHGILEAVSFLHSKKIYNLEIKPQNFYLCNKSSLKFCFINYSLTQAPRISRNRVVSYMAPQIIVKKSINYKADIWSIGVTFYELLEGEVPFQGVNQIQILQSIRKGLTFSKKTSVQQFKLVKQILKQNPLERLELVDIIKKNQAGHSYVKTTKVSKFQAATKEQVIQSKIKLLEVKQFPRKNRQNILNPENRNRTQRVQTEIVQGKKQQQNFQTFKKPSYFYSLQSRPRISLKKFSNICSS